MSNINPYDGCHHDYGVIGGLKTVKPPKYFRKKKLRPDISAKKLMTSFLALHLKPHFYVADDCLFIIFVTPKTVTVLDYVELDICS